MEVIRLNYILKESNSSLITFVEWSQHHCSSTFIYSIKQLATDSYLQKKPEQRAKVLWVVEGMWRLEVKLRSYILTMTNTKQAKQSNTKLLQVWFTTSEWCQDSEFEGVFLNDSCHELQPVRIHSENRGFIRRLSFPAVPLRTPELTLTSHSSTDIQISWQPLPAKLSRGRLSAYRLSYRTAADSTVVSLEIPQNSTRHLLENLQPDTIYLLRMAAATRVGWCEPSAWTSHRTPKTSSSKGKR